MSKLSMTREEIDIYRKYRVGVIDAIAKDEKDNQKYKKAALRNDWIKKIKALHLAGYTSQEIYEKLGDTMKKAFGYDQLKTIEHFCKEQSKKQDHDDLEK